MRSLLVASSLLCASLGFWEGSESRAVRDVMRAASGWQPQVVAPYILAVRKSDNLTVKSTYHVWLLGAVLDLPYTSRRPETDGIILGGVRPHVVIEVEEDQRLGVPME